MEEGIHPRSFGSEITLTELRINTRHHSIPISQIEAVKVIDKSNLVEFFTLIPVIGVFATAFILRNSLDDFITLFPYSLSGWISVIVCLLAFGVLMKVCLKLFPGGCFLAVWLGGKRMTVVNFADASILSDVKRDLLRRITGNEAFEETEYYSSSRLRITNFQIETDRHAMPLKQIKDVQMRFDYQEAIKVASCIVLVALGAFWLSADAETPNLTFAIIVSVTVGLAGGTHFLILRRNMLFIVAEDEDFKPITIRTISPKVLRKIKEALSVAVAENKQEKEKRATGKPRTPST